MEMKIKMDVSRIPTIYEPRGHIAAGLDSADDEL